MDLLAAYTEHSGSLELILSHIPHSSHADEARFVALIDAAIKRKEIESIPEWEAQKKDEKSRNKRRREGEKEAGEAEQAAKDMGVWDEFYGSGKAAPKKKKTGKAKKVSPGHCRSLRKRTRRICREERSPLELIWDNPRPLFLSCCYPIVRPTCH